jgi:hypothetical protein
MTTPQKFRKRPVVIEAMRFDKNNGPSIARWCGGLHYDGYLSEWIEIPTLEGTMSADPGDWIIQGVHGEFYPCKPDIFALTYEAVES